jgi:hypothetical protein
MQSILQSDQRLSMFFTKPNKFRISRHLKRLSAKIIVRKVHVFDIPGDYNFVTIKLNLDSSFLLSVISKNA